MVRRGAGYDKHVPQYAKQLTGLSVGFSDGSSVYMIWAYVFRGDEW